MRAARCNPVAKERPCCAGPRARAVDPLRMRSGTGTGSLGPNPTDGSQPIGCNPVTESQDGHRAPNDRKRSDPEPQVSLHGKFPPVSAVANFVAIVNEPVPNGIYDFLCQVI